MPLTHAQANQRIINSIVNNGDPTLQDLLSEYSNLKAAHKSTLFIVQMIMLKIQSLSDELQNSYVLANQDISNLDQDLNNIKNDLNNIMQNGDPTGSMAKKLAKDIAQYKKDLKKLEKDKKNNESSYPGAWKNINMADLKSLKKMFNDEPTGNASWPTFKQLIDAVKNGDSGAASALTGILNQWYTNHKNDPTKTNDIAYRWLNGGDATTNNNGISPVIVEADGVSGQDTDQINKFGTIIQTEYQAGGGIIQQIVQLESTINQGIQQLSGG